MRLKHLLTIISCFFALNFTAQEVVVEYPYNPDFENDGNVGVEDLLQLLSSFGMAFEVGELTIDEVVLSEWLQTISETLIAQQAMIDSLSSLTSALDSAGVADLLSQANFGTSAGGFNPSYPVIRGTHDLRFNTAAGYSSYTVPTDSIFIIEHAAPSGTAGALLINDIVVWSVGYGLDSRPLQQLYVGPGETVTSTQGNTWNIHGYLVPNESITPLTIAIPGQEFYTIPAGKQFVISTINGDATGSLQIDNVYRGSYSTAGVQAGLNELYVPLVCSSSTTLFMNNNPDKTATINGYLVDEDYFESSSPSVTSETESLGLAFGERIHLSEPEDWGPLPWDDYVNYGTYAFDDQGIFMGYMKGPFYNIYVLNDSIEMEDISSSELQTHSVVEITNGPDAFSIIVGTNERVIVRGMPNSFEYPENERNFDWIPVQSPVNAVSDGSSVGSSVENIFEVDFEDINPALIPPSCTHLIVNPPNQIPFWEVKGYGPAGWTQLISVPHDNVLDTIAQSGIYDVSEIVGYTSNLEIDLNHFTSDEVFIEWGDMYDWYSQILPSLEFFHSALGDDDWTSDNIVTSTPRVLVTQAFDEIGSWGVQLVTQNVDYSTTNGPSDYNADYHITDASHLGMFRKTAAGFWVKSWGWQN